MARPYEQRKFHKLSEASKYEIPRLRRAGYSVTKLVELYDTTRQTIWTYTKDIS